MVITGLLTTDKSSGEEDQLQCYEKKNLVNVDKPCSDTRLLSSSLPILRAFRRLINGEFIISGTSQSAEPGITSNLNLPKTFVKSQVTEVVITCEKKLRIDKSSSAKGFSGEALARRL